MKMFFSMALLFSLVLGCGNKSRPQPLPPPPAPGGVVLLPGWGGVTNDVAARAVFKGGETTVPVKCLAPGAVELPVDFSGKNPPARANWDIKLNCDLQDQEGVQFDFFCEDLDQFSNFSVYFKCGEGWHHCSCDVEESGQWQHVKVLKSGGEVEGKVGPWSKVSMIRLSGWRGGTKKFRCAIANFAYLNAGPHDVLLVYAASLAEKGGAEGKSYSHFADTMAGSLRRLGLVTRIVGDKELTADLVKASAAVILPYNTAFPNEKVPLLADYVAAGGRLLACYSQAQAVTELLGVKIAATKSPEAAGLPGLAGFVRGPAALANQPDFAPNASWFMSIPVVKPGVDVVANWAGGNHQSLGVPGIVRTKRGLFMGHVWLGGTDEASCALMRALVVDLAPKLDAKIAAHAAQVKKHQQEQRAWLASRPSKKGEHRAFWCHSAWGLGGSYDWESSVKFLKDNGFNALHPNLSWGGVAFYNSKVLPVSPSVAKKGDAFDLCRAACKKYGVEMHVWKVCWNMGRYTAEAFVKKMEAEKRTQVDWRGNKKERWLCPSHPENQKLEIEAMVELAKKGPDGIHFDYIRYPGTDCCFCDGCRARFEAVHGAKVENWPADVRDEKKLKNEWNAFRAGNITKVVQTVAERVRKEAPGVKISAALFRSAVNDPHTVAQDWPAWCREGWLDFACHMDYTLSTPAFRGSVKSQIKAAGKVPLYPGIGLSCWVNDGTDAEHLAKQIQAARDLGLGGFTVFNFDRRAEQALPLMRLGVTKED